MAPVWLQQVAEFLDMAELPAIIAFLFLSFFLKLKQNRRGLLILAGAAAVIFALALCRAGILLYMGQTSGPFFWELFLVAASAFIAKSYFSRAKGLR